MRERERMHLEERDQGAKYKNIILDDCKYLFIFNKVYNILLLISSSLSSSSYTFPSNHNIDKSLYALCFGHGRPLINVFM